MAKAPSKLEQLRQMREKPGNKPKVSVIAEARAKTKAARAAKAAKPKAAKPKASNGERGAKSLAIAELLKRAKGCTRKDALEATGWPSVSMGAMAKQLGIKLRIEKEPGERTRYFGA